MTHKPQSTVRRIWITAAIVVLAGATMSWAGFAGTDVFVASVGHGSGSGESQWRTTLWIHNPGSSAADCQIQLLFRGQPNPSPPTYNLTVQPGDTVKYDDATWALFGIEGFGALRVLSSRDVVVNSRIYNQPGGDPSNTQGQFFSAVPRTFAVAAGESTDVLGVNQAYDGRFRYNFGFVETTGNPVTFTVALHDGSGSVIGSRTYTLEGFEPMQIGIADLDVGSTPTDNGRLHVDVTGGSGRLIAFGSGIANTSQDPSTFDMTMVCESGSGGSGDITAVTAGDGLAGGGSSGDVTLYVPSSGINASMIQDGAVDTDKISSWGASSGQVLKYTGSGVTWAADETGGMSLPYSGQSSTAGVAFGVENTGGGFGIKGTTNGMYGVYGVGGSSANAGVRGYIDNPSGEGVNADNGGTDASAYLAGRHAVWGQNNNASYGAVYGQSTASNGLGVHGEANSGSLSAGVMGESYYGVGVFAISTNGLAAWLYGDVVVDDDLDVNGTLSKGGGSFKIDHPLDPENKYLYHSFVESPDMMNIYNGNVVTDGDGFATVTLPDWFEALNRDFRYQLTVIGDGGWAQARVAEEIEGNAFVIQTSVPDTKVSWQVTGVRQDAWAEANRIPVEQPKPAIERGSYLHPEAFGQPAQAGAEWAQRPQLLERARRSAGSSDR